MAYFDIQNLGPRICIIGRSNSGKSTLAIALGKKTGLTVYHLDQIAHVPGTAWERRPDADFIKDHNEIIKKENWLIEGNYGVCMPQRFERATSVIWLDLPAMGSVLRYVGRSLKHKPQRPGNLHGAAREFSPSLLKYMIFNYPKNCLKYKKFLADKELDPLHIRSMKQLKSLYTVWQL